MKIRFFEQTNDGWKAVSANYALSFWEIDRETNPGAFPNFEKKIGELVLRGGLDLHGKAHGMISVGNIHFAVFVEDEGQTVAQMRQEIEDGLKVENG